MKELQDFGRVQMRGSAPRPPGRASVTWLPPRLLSAILVGLLVWSIRVVPSPEINVPSFDLPLAVSRGEGESLKVRIARESSFMLTLHCDAKNSYLSYSSYGLSVRNLQREVWLVQDTKTSSYRTFNVSVPGEVLDPGKYQVVLWGYDRNRPGRVLLDSYPLDFGYSYK
jgi:hypothetical protein